MDRIYWVFENQENIHERIRVLRCKSSPPSYNNLMMMMMMIMMMIMMITNDLTSLDYGLDVSWYVGYLTEFIVMI